jgi:hypothetical protein
MALGWVVVAPLRGTGRILAEGVRSVLQAYAEHDARLILSGTMPTLPPLYASGVRFEPEDTQGTGYEEWADPWLVWKRGKGDCDDLVRWRAAELLAAKELKVHVASIWDDVTQRYHVAVRRASGGLEDPSKVLLLMRG